MVDATEGVLGIEWIDGQSVRKLLPGGAEEYDEGDEGEDLDGDTSLDDDEDRLVAYGISLGAYRLFFSSSLRSLYLHAQTSLCDW